MNNSFKQALLLVLIGLATQACVSKKKYQALEDEKFKLANAKAACDTTVTGFDKRYKNLQALNGTLKNDTSKLGTVIRKQRNDYGKLDRSYNQLLANSANEAASLSADLKRKESSLADLERNLNNTKGQVDQLNQNLKAREARVAELEKVLADKDKAVQNLKDIVSKALLSFKDGDLSVNIKNGKVYVSLSEQLLFKSGKFDVDTKGVEAIKKLATVLKSNPDVNVTIEGHTDDVPLAGNSAGMKDNWDLSVLRATSIARVLAVEGVPGNRLTSSGRSQYVPLDNARTADARQKNRRTEIILQPKLDELFKVLEN